MTDETSTATFQGVHAYWRAANDLSVGQIFLWDNPLLKRPPTLSDVKHMLLGHWVTTPGQNFIYLLTGETDCSIATRPLPGIDEPLANRLIITAIR